MLNRSTGTKWNCSGFPDARAADGGGHGGMARDSAACGLSVKIAWGGYFPSLYPDATLNAKYVDFAVRGQGEDTLLELIEAMRGNRRFESILRLS